MTIIYVVNTRKNYANSEIIGVFSTRIAALDFCAVYNDGYPSHTAFAVYHELDEHIIDRRQKRPYYIRMDLTGGIHSSYYDMHEDRSNTLALHIEKHHSNILELRGTVHAHKCKEAVEMANRFRLAILAANMWKLDI